MKILIDVKMKAEYIYDLMLFHTYSKFSGFMINMLGLAVIVMGGLSLGMGRINMGQCMVYLIAGVAFLSFTPLTLRRRAKQMMKCEKYSQPIGYAFDEEGFEENIQGNITTYTWKEVQKAISTPKDIAFYVKDDIAVIIPKESFGENFMPVMKLVANNLTRDKIYIR